MTLRRPPLVAIGVVALIVGITLSIAAAPYWGLLGLGGFWLAAENL